MLPVLLDRVLSFRETFICQNVLLLGNDSHVREENTGEFKLRFEVWDS
jgi:hypothetical protein